MFFYSNEVDFFYQKDAFKSVISPKSFKFRLLKVHEQTTYNVNPGTLGLLALAKNTQDIQGCFLGDLKHTKFIVLFGTIWYGTATTYLTYFATFGFLNLTYWTLKAMQEIVKKL